MPTTPPCPMCGRPAEQPRLRPFCSKRCADIDLGRWFGGAYRIPAEPASSTGNEPDET